MLSQDLSREASEVDTQLSALGCRVTWTGAWVICPGTPTTDIDLIVDRQGLAGATVIEWLETNGFRSEANQNDYDESGRAEQSQRYKRGSIDVVLCMTPEWAEKMRLATKLATKFKLCDKADRVALFQAVENGYIPGDRDMWGKDRFGKDPTELEPTDDQIYNGPGIEGGVRYPMAYHDYI